jgi:8-oxo-dGTP diphosphatase
MATAVELAHDGGVRSEDDGDGWVSCAQGHDHWGRFGAAGLLLWHDGSVLLQHRSRWSHHGGTWGVMGGARNRGETAAQAAQREADEESGLEASAYSVVAEHVDDHGGWAYTTVVGRALSPALPRMLSWETVELRWVPADRVATMPLHPGFAETWATVRALDVG